MLENKKNPFDIVEVDSHQITASPTLEPVKWSDFAKQALLSGTPIKAEDLVGKEFDILRAKYFDSSFEGQDHAWYCVVRMVGDPEVYAVTLGGQAVVEVLDAYAATGSQHPLRVKLGFHDGGKFNGYYTFEM